jgi:hypothetical protein
LRSFSNLRSDFHGGNTGSNPVGDTTLEPTTSNGSPLTEWLKANPKGHIDPGWLAQEGDVQI